MPTTYHALADALFSPTAQAKLLRLLQEGTFRPLGAERPLQVDRTIVAATSRDLAARVREGQFRDDLYHRLNALRLHLPPRRALG